MTKPFLFLDIDGCLNSFGGLDVWGDDEEHWLSPFGEGPFKVTVSKRMAAALNSLDCELWWATTWQTEAHLVGDIIGLEGGVLDLDAQPGWKHAAVQRKLNEDPRPFVWFEDQPWILGTNNRVSREKWPPGFVVNPNPLTGITPENVQKAERFLDGER